MILLKRRLQTLPKRLMNRKRALRRLGAEQMTPILLPPKLRSP